MLQRGRKSATALEVTGAVELIERADAPYDLTDEEAGEWRAIVDGRPASYFPKETHAMLADYCRHVCKARRIAGMIQALEAAVRESAQDEGKTAVEAMLGAIGAVDKLYAMAERETRAIASLATKMRFSQQTNIRADAAQPPKATRKPWEA
jgi:hypothetical protein